MSTIWSIILKNEKNNGKVLDGDIKVTIIYKSSKTCVKEDK